MPRSAVSAIRPRRIAAIHAKLSTIIAVRDDRAGDRRPGGLQPPHFDLGAHALECALRSQLARFHIVKLGRDDLGTRLHVEQHQDQDDFHEKPFSSREGRHLAVPTLLENSA